MNLFAFQLPFAWQGTAGSLIAQTGLVAKIVLLLLLAFSVFSWAIIYSKWRSFQRLKMDGERFVRAFRKARRLPEMVPMAENFPSHPLKALFEAGYKEILAQEANPTGAVRNPAAVSRALQIAASDQLSRLERHLSWLATTGAVAPFIGLFGTV